MKKKRSLIAHIAWIFGVATSWILINYYSKGEFTRADIIGGFAFASIMEFGFYCRQVYMNDNEEQLDEA